MSLSLRKRYFLNNLIDYSPGEELQINPLKWKERISNFVTTITQHQPPSSKDCNGGLYVGCSGIGYMMYHVSNSAAFDKEREDYVKQGLNYMNVALQYAKSHKRDSKSVSAFLLGHSGVYAVSAVLYAAAGMKEVAGDCISEFVSSGSHLKHHLASSDELFVGRAGFVAGGLWLNGALGPATVPRSELHEMCAWIIQSGRRYAEENRSPCPLMFSYYDTEYLGAAHGVCTILQMLLSCPEFLESDQRASDDIRATVDFLLSLQTPSGNFPCALDEVGRPRAESDELVHWCHGAPGVVYLMAKAYLVWGDDKYLRSCLKCGELVWNKGLLKKGPGICHGVAGSGYVFLLLYRLTQDPQHLHRAQQFAEFIYTPEFKQGARTPDSPYSLYEGLAGTVCFLVDLLTPDTASFPFQNVL